MDDIRKVLAIIGSRMVQLVIMVLLLSFVTFLLMKVTPGDPIRAILKVDDVITTTVDEERLRKEYGFDQPILQQYSQWIWNVVQQSE